MNDIRLRFDGVAGVLSTAIDDVAGTVESEGLADLGVVDASGHAALSLFRLDPTGRPAQLEIVHVTAHEEAATSATVTRGAEGTTRYAWSAGDRWLHGATAYDLILKADDSAVLHVTGAEQKTGSLTLLAGDAVTTPLVLRSTAGQSADLLNLCDEAGDSVLRVNTGGGVIMGKPTAGGAALLIQTLSHRAPFYIGGGHTTYNGTVDDSLMIGYNRGGGGAKIVGGEPSFGLTMETQVDDGPSPTPVAEHAMELNLDYSTAANVGRRFMAFRTNKYDPLLFTHWSFAISGASTSGAFRINDLNGTALFVVTATGDTAVTRDMQSYRHCSVGGGLFAHGGVVTFDAPNRVEALSWKDGQLKLTAAHDNVTALRLVASPGQAPPLATFSGPASFTGMISTRLTADTADRFVLRADGRMEWGAGSGVADVVVARGAPATLTFQTRGTIFGFPPGFATPNRLTSWNVGGVERLAMNVDTGAGGYASLLTIGLGGIEMLKDSNASRGAAMGLGVPVGTVQDDLVFSTYRSPEPAWRERVRITNGGFVGLNTATPAAHLDQVIPGNGVVGHSIRAASSQAADLLRMTDDANGVLSRFGKKGWFVTKVQSAPSLADLADGEMALSTDGSGSLVVTSRVGSVLKTAKLVVA